MASRASAPQPRRHHVAFLRTKPPLPPPPAAPPAPANGKAAPSCSKPKQPTSPAKAPSPSLEERTVKQLRLGKPLTLPEATTVSEACRIMATRLVDAALLTDANGMLSGIVTAEDVAGRVIAEGLKPEETNVAKVMTRNPVFVESNASATEALQKMVQGSLVIFLQCQMDVAGRVIAEGLKPEETNVAKVMTRNPVFVESNASATEALQKMVQGKFRHLPVVENGGVVAMLDITKFLYGAISKMEKAAEQGSAIADAMEGVDRQWGNEFAGPNKFIENLREQMFKPSLSTIITENRSVPSVSPSDLVTVAAKRMRECRVNSVIVMAGNTLQGILTSKDLVWRVVARSLSPEVTRVEKVMSACPGCATLDTSILEALQSMQNGRFRHIPVADKRGQIVACLDVLQLTNAAMSMAEGASGPNDVANTMVQKFWDSALALHPAEDHDSHSDESHTGTTASDHAEEKHIPPHVGNTFSYKIEDRNGRKHRFSCVSESLDELVSAIANRLGTENEKAHINLLYDDDEGDRVLLATDSDLIAAIEHARSAGWKFLRLHMDGGSEPGAEATLSPADALTGKRSLLSLRLGIVAGAVAIAGVGVIVYLRRSEL